MGGRTNCSREFHPHSYHSHIITRTPQSPPKSVSAFTHNTISHRPLFILPHALCTQQRRSICGPCMDDVSEGATPSVVESPIRMCTAVTSSRVHRRARQASVRIHAHIFFLPTWRSVQRDATLAPQPREAQCSFRGINWQLVLH